jgi:uncharacterized protein (DUF983 family)
MSAIQAIARQLCPRCREGRIFRKSLLRGWLSMNESCPVCGLRLAREPGYFLGAMYVSYGLSLVPALFLVFLFWRVFGLAYYSALLAATLAYLPLVPMVVRMSRVLWIYFDQTSDPEQ